MKKTNRLIVGSALGLAAIVVAIDHTKHRLPDPIPATQEQLDMSDDDDESPCGMGSDSSSMDDDSESPCSMDSMDSDDEDSSPCGLGE